MEQFKFACHYCRELFFFGELTKDHIVPRAKGGRDYVENVVPSCSACNGAKGDQMPTCECVFCLNAVELWRQDRLGVPVYRKEQWVREGDKFVKP